MSDGTRAATDQIRAHVRDLTPGQLVEFIVAMSAHAEKHAQRVAESGRPDLAGPIGLASSLAATAAIELRKTIPGECVAEPIAAINRLVYGR